MSPIYSVQVLGGQNFYSGQRNSLSGNASGVVAPAMKIDENWSVLPSFNSSYQGTEQVLDIVGAGTLFQHQWDNRLGAKAIYTPDDSPWRFKPSVSGKYEFLQQTKDEQLGKGLYDYETFDAGMDTEYVYHEPFALRFGLDYYQNHFPNYTSLESQAATSFQGQSLARELVGNYVLDTQNVLLTFGGEGPLSERYILQGTGSFLYSKFPNQHIVDAQGDLTSPLRSDIIGSVAVSLKMPAELNSDLRALGAFELAGTYDKSNQNSYDATAGQYIPSYYNYAEVRVGPNVKVLVGPAREATVVGLGVNYWYRRYPDRPLQDANGAYIGGSIHMNNWMVNGSLTYPMAPHFAVVFNAQYGRGTSNEHFEQFYKYNYTTTNYLFGFTYDY